MRAALGLLPAEPVDTGAGDELVREMKAPVGPGHRAVILLTGGGDLEAIITELRRFSGARLLPSDLPVEARAAVEPALSDGMAVDHEIVPSPVNG